MKNLILDFLRGVRTGLFYVMLLGLIAYGIALLCFLHAATAWLAILGFLIALGAIAAGVIALWLLGKAEKDMVNKGSIVRDIRRKLESHAECLPGERTSYPVVKFDDIYKVLNDVVKD